MQARRESRPSHLGNLDRLVSLAHAKEAALFSESSVPEKRGRTEVGSGHVVIVTMVSESRWR